MKKQYASKIVEKKAVKEMFEAVWNDHRADQTALDLTKAFPSVTLLAKPFDFRELKQCLERIGQD